MMDPDPATTAILNAPAEPSIVEVSIDYPLSRPVALTIGVYLIVVIGGCAALSFSIGMGTYAIWTTMATLVIFLTGWGFASRWIAKRYVDRLHVSEGSQVVEQTKALLQRTKRIQAMAALHRWIERLAAMGQAGLVLRVSDPKQRSRIDPIQVPFEPQPLDETNATLRHLSAGDSGADAHDGVPADATWHRIVRNIQLKGGWLMVGIFGFNVLMHGVFAYHERRVTGSLIIWTGALLAALLYPAGSAHSTRKQVLVVPGGLLFRKADKKRAGWKVHLFQRGDAVLCAYQPSKRQWMIVVADGARRETVAGTHREIEFALQAWLSPVPPPDVDHLDDLM